MKNRFLNRFSRVDVAALLVFVAVWTYHILTVRYGFCSADESFYITIAQRFMYGDRPLVDEWNLSQFTQLFLYLPFRSYVALTGGTTGILLFLRYWFLAFNAVFYWTMYAFLRVYRWPALVASLLFSLYIPLIYFDCNHYTVPPRLMMIVCLILFSEKSKPPAFFLAGVLLACSVLYYPGLTLLYIAYSVLVWMRFSRQKKGECFLDDFASCLRLRAWICITVSVVLCFAAFTAWLFLRSDLRDILTTLPYSVLNPDFALSAENGGKKGFLFKLMNAIRIYSPVCFIAAIAVIVLSAAYSRGLFRTRRSTARKILFCFASAVWILSCIQAFRVNGGQDDLFFSMYPVTLLWFGFVCFLLCEQKNKQLLLFWIVGLVSSVCIGFLSNSTLSLCSPISYIADLVFFLDLVRELRSERSAETGAGSRRRRNPKKTNRLDLVVRGVRMLVCVCFAAWFSFVFVFENTAFPEFFRFGSPYFSLPYRYEKGPCAGIRCSDFIGQDYARHLEDIDTIKEKGAKNLYICGLAPELYLYADLPYAASSAWGWRQTSFLLQQIPYWELHPERRPEYIYLPADQTYNNHASAQEQTAWIHDSFDALCEYTLEQGRGGYILFVSQWHLASEAD